MIKFNPKEDKMIDGYLFHKTCDMCPEQYNVYKDKKQVAYVRLRFGHLRVEVPRCLMKLVYEKRYPNQLFKGCFDNEEERMEELKKIVEILEIKRRNKNGKSRNGFTRTKGNRKQSKRSTRTGTSREKRATR